MSNLDFIRAFSSKPAGDLTPADVARALALATFRPATEADLSTYSGLDTHEGVLIGEVSSSDTGDDGLTIVIASDGQIQVLDLELGWRNATIDINF